MCLSWWPPSHLRQVWWGEHRVFLCSWARSTAKAVIVSSGSIPQILCFLRQVELFPTNLYASETGRLASPQLMWMPSGKAALFHLREYFPGSSLPGWKCTQCLSVFRLGADTGISSSPFTLSLWCIIQGNDVIHRKAEMCASCQK